MVWSSQIATVPEVFSTERSHCADKNLNKTDYDENNPAGFVVLLVTSAPAFHRAGEPDDRDQAKLEEKLWDPECPLTNKQIDQFLVVARYDILFA